MFSYNVVKSKFDDINTEAQIGKMVDYSVISNQSLFVLTKKELFLVTKTSAETAVEALNS